MKIAVDTRHLQSGYLQDSDYFLFEILKRITKNNLQHEFIFIFDRPYDKNLLFTENITPVIKGPKINNLLLSRYWYDIKIPAVLKKYKADLFIAGNGMCSLTAKTPQCLILDDLSYVHYPSFFTKADLFFLKRYTKKFLQKANRVIALSDFLQKSIVSLNSITEEKINVIHGSALGSFVPLNEMEKEEIKNKYSNGKNYFIYTGSIHPRKNLINLLKAFSVFKKRQKSDWKLVLAGDVEHGDRSFAGSMKTYKYRADVIRIDRKNEDTAKLTGSAYAFVCPSFWEGSGLQLLTALQSGTPVIASFNSAMQEIAGDAALYIDPSDYKDIADKMMLLYKDESLRSNLIEKGKLIAGQYTWEKAADLFWQSILKAIK